jgi:hypothetical protein
MRVVLAISGRTIRSFVRQSLVGETGEFEIIEPTDPKPLACSALLENGSVLVVSGDSEHELLRQVLELKKSRGSAFSCVFLSADEGMRFPARA